MNDFLVKGVDSHIMPASRIMRLSQIGRRLSDITPRTLQTTTTEAVDVGQVVSQIKELLGITGPEDGSPSDVDSVPQTDSATSTCSTPPTSPSSGASSDEENKNPKMENHMLYFQIGYGPPCKVPAAHLPSISDTTSAERLRAIVAKDEAVRNQYPDVYNHGVYVFLDQSNIYLSYLNTLKEKFNITSEARFAPNPTFDLDILTELVVRNRRVRTLRASCSVIPGRSQPEWIKQLQQLDYKVDVRERKAIQHPYKPYATRHVEDLVDETLQIRIGEAFMRAAGKKGTMILVTGDAQPAPYSDGFYKYATRALKAGWNVEVVSWKCSCSSLWKELAAKMESTHRFRLIELDDYLDHLWCRDRTHT
jgi:hypothetical protein